MDKDEASYRYNNTGITRGLIRELLYNNSPYNFEKPCSDIELATLGKFFFGVELKLKEFTYLINPLDNYFSRKLKIYNHTKKDIDINTTGYFVCENIHNTYYDGEFYHNSKELDIYSSYDFDGYFWKNIFGDYLCGGIAGSCYAQFYVKTISEYKRLTTWIENRNVPAREVFIKEMMILEYRNKKFYETN